MSDPYCAWCDHKHEDAARVPEGLTEALAAVALLRSELSLLMAHTAISRQTLRIEAVVRAQQALDDTKAMADLRDANIRDAALAERGTE